MDTEEREMLRKIAVGLSLIAALISAYVIWESG